MVALTYPSGRIVSVGRDATGRVGGVTMKKNAGDPDETLASDAAYQPFGDLQSLTYGNGLSLWKTFTDDDELSMLLVEVPGANALVQRYLDRTDDGLNLTHIWDGLNPARSESFWYNATRRLQNASGPWGDTTYYYDGVGNRTYEILTAGGTTATTVEYRASGANRLAEMWTDAVLTRSLSYDAAGNRTGDLKGGTPWSFAYNNAGRLATATAGGSLKGSYIYDGLQRLAVRLVSDPPIAGTRHYIYDTAGHLLAEADGATGTTLREYVWLEIADRGADPGPTADPTGRSGIRLGAAERDSDPTARAQLPSLLWPKRGIAARAMPLAVAADVETATPKTYFVHADHLDRPIMMTDSTKAIAWEAIYKPYGEVHSVSGPASQDARFPGQWFQIETGLHYNWHRQYDPSTGRYLEPDPLGFVDGASVYGYAGSSPLMRTDPEGLLPGRPMTPRPDKNAAQQCSSKPNKAEYCYEQCKNLMGLDNGNVYRGCFRRCMGQNLG